jgi:hypothetical protein
VTSLVTSTGMERTELYIDDGGDRRQCAAPSANASATK